MKKFIAILLAVVMVFALGVSAFAADTTPVTTMAVGEGLTITVDYDVEGMYFEGNTLKNAATNGYYPFSFSLIVSNRNQIHGRPEVLYGPQQTLIEDDCFHWAYLQNEDGSFVTDDEGNYVEDPNTNYGLVTLPVGEESVLSVCNENGDQVFVNCAAPSGGTTATGTALYAYLPAPAQFVNEGVTTGGWGDAYDSNGAVKANSTTGVSLGFFGGYAVYKFSDYVWDLATNPYGADFIVYGNAFWNNSEAGCIQVSENGTDWFDIAGSMYYTKSTKNATITYTNPNPSEDKGITTAGATSTLADVTYTLNGTEGKVTKNTFHNHSWFPLNANYFTASGSRAAMAKVDEFSFVSRTLNSDNITNTLTFTGTLLNNYPGTGKTDQIGFGYCDVHPNKTLGGSIAYNPYQTFTSSSDYDTKVAGTSGGDPIDIAWAVKSDGTPAGLSKIQYVRIYTGMAQMNGVFGEISTEVCGVAACTGTGAGKATTDLVVRRGTRPVTTTNNTAVLVTAGNNFKITSSEENVYLNGVKVTASAGYSFTVESGKAYQIITQSGTEAPYITVLVG